MAESPVPQDHKLTLDQRKHLTLTGATEVLHFQEDLVELDTTAGPMTITGQDLKLKCLSLDGGVLSITGSVEGITYAPPRRRGWFG